MSLATLIALSADQVVAEADLDGFFPGTSSGSLRDGFKSVITNQIEHTFDYRLQVQSTHDFIKALWTKFDCASIADIYEGYIGFEEAMYGLERDSASGKRYRDHFVHMFNCFGSGMRIMAKLMASVSEAEAESLLKVRSEDLKKAGLPFGQDYSIKQRLAYLWVLMATFHDIAVPFQHFTKLAGGMERFIKAFGWSLTSPTFKAPGYDTARLEQYFNHLGEMYSGEFEAEDDLHYKLSKTRSKYLSRRLGLEFDKGNHGVISGYFLYRTMEDIFLLNKTTKYKLDAEQFGRYTELVLDQDVARAALASSLHNLEPAQFKESGVFPIDFAKHPLSFLLILVDELQEFLRWEGSSIVGSMKFNFQPHIDLSVKGNVITINWTFAFSSSQKEYLIDQAKQIAIIDSLPALADDKIDTAVTFIGQQIKKRLEAKLMIGSNFLVNLLIYENWKRLVYSNELNSVDGGAV